MDCIFEMVVLPFQFKDTAVAEYNSAKQGFGSCRKDIKGRYLQLRLNHIKGLFPLRDVGLTAVNSWICTFG